MSKYVETHAKESFTNVTFLGDVKAVKQNKSVNANIHLVMVLWAEGCMHGIQMTRIVPAQHVELSNTKCLVMMMALIWLGVENV